MLKKLKPIKLLVLDVDGVLTAGEVIYDDSGKEIKIFNVHDGLGLRMIMKAGIQVALITGRRSKALVYRCKNLGIEKLYDGVRDKVAALEQIISETGLSIEETAYMGDDLADLAIMKIAGLPIAVADAHELIIDQAGIITTANGGCGAVREICEALLKAQGVWEKIITELF